MFSTMSEEQVALRDKIQREHIIRREDNIVLVEDFFGCAVLPALEQGTALEAIYGEAATKSLERIELLPVMKGRPVFGVPYSALTAAGKERQEVFIQSRVDEKIQENEDIARNQALSIASSLGRGPDAIRILYGDSVEALQAELEKGIDDGFVRIAMPSPEEIRPSIERKVKEISGFVAVYLADIVESMREEKGFFIDDGIERFESRSLKKGEGETALNFWRAVNTLDDYSHLYSDPPDLPSDRKKPEVKLNPAWDWIPGAPKPVY